MKISSFMGIMDRAAIYDFLAVFIVDIMYYMAGFCDYLKTNDSGEVVKDNPEHLQRTSASLPE